MIVNALLGRLSPLFSPSAMFNMFVLPPFSCFDTRIFAVIDSSIQTGIFGHSHKELLTYDFFCYCHFSNSFLFPSIPLWILTPNWVAKWANRHALTDETLGYFVKLFQRSMQSGFLFVKDSISFLLAIVISTKRTSKTFFLLERKLASCFERISLPLLFWRNWQIFSPFPIAHPCRKNAMGRPPA